MKQTAGIALKPGAALILTGISLVWIYYSLRPLLTPASAGITPVSLSSATPPAIVVPTVPLSSESNPDDITFAENAEHGVAIKPLAPGEGTVTLENAAGKLRTHESTRMVVRVAPDKTRITVLKSEPEQWWIAQAYCAYPPAIKQGETLYLHIRARSETKNPVWIVLEEGPTPYRKNFAHRLELTPRWTDYAFKFDTKVEDVADRSRLRVQAGEKAGEIEISHLEMRRLKP